MPGTLYWTMILIGIAGFYRLGASPSPGAPVLSRAPHIVWIRVSEFLAIGVFLAVKFAAGWDPPLTSRAAAAAYAGLALTAAGVLLTSWAKYELRSNFTYTLGIRRDHRLITGGPYSLVRHPIYTGLLLEVIGGALVYNSSATLLLLAAPICCCFYWQSIEEEQLLAHRFGPDYLQYRAKTGRLTPRLL